jgi:hypothetical protein
VLRGRGGGVLEGVPFVVGLEGDGDVGEDRKLAGCR